jgi:hypothetical protein
MLNKIVQLAAWFATFALQLTIALSLMGPVDFFRSLLVLSPLAILVCVLAWMASKDRQLKEEEYWNSFIQGFAACMDHHSGGFQDARPQPPAGIPPRARRRWEDGYRAAKYALLTLHD